MCIKVGEKKKALSGVCASFLILHPCQTAEGIWRETLSGEVCGSRVCHGKRFASLVSALELRDPNLGWEVLEIGFGVSPPRLEADY